MPLVSRSAATVGGWRMGDREQRQVGQHHAGLDVERAGLLFSPGGHLLSDRPAIHPGSGGCPVASTTPPWGSVEL